MIGAAEASMSLPVTKLLVVLLLLVGAGSWSCSSATRVDGDADGDADTGLDADTDRDTGGDADDDVLDADPEATCPPAVGSDIAQVTTPVVTTDPDSFVDEEIVVVGTLMTNRSYACTDDGICGTCSPGLTLDGAIRLQGPGPGGQLCDRSIGCVERVDSCLPHWECWPFEIGRRVRVRGFWRSDHDSSPAMDEWERLQQGWHLEVTAIEPTGSVAGVGLFEGTAFVGAIEGSGCVSFPNSFPVEVVVAYGSPGYVAEPMSPGEPGPGSDPFWSGWHTGPAGEGPTISLAAAMGLGTLVLTATDEGYSGSYEFSLSGLDCRVESTFEFGQVY
jgi:hypothetical protein